jgi:hypothetical protein
MKIVKSFGIIAAALIFASCASKPVKGEGFTFAASKAEIVDYKGQSFGADIPSWVIDATNGKSKETVAKALGLKNKMIWILQRDGQNLDMLQMWTDQVDGRTEIASGIEQNVGDIVKASMTNESSTDVNRKVSEYSTRLSNITLNGLSKETDYWTKTRSLKTGVKKALNDSDYNYKYTYLVVFSMDENVYERQLNAALDDLDNYDDQAETLRKRITEQLMNQIEIEVEK